MVVATGFFDGVHLGHRFLIERLTNEARLRGTQSLIVTFWPHPRNVLQNDARDFRLLSSMQEKKALLLEMGVDRVEVLDFTRAFSTMTMREYIRQVLIGRFGAKCLVLGYDNRMGCDCRDSSELADIAREEGLEVVRVGVLKSGSLECRDAQAGFISSTRIRNALAEGRVEDAAAMLGRPYSLHGVVVSGNRLGRTIGFPTANMQLYEPLKAIPAPGVYAVSVNIPSAWSERPFGSNDYLGMCNIGYRPTVGVGNALTIETHILDFDEDIYGLDIHIHFLKRIREERKFDSLAALADQLKTDREQVRNTR
ncbi:MAG: riboflavin biosynthesis protein RibF [Bacteroidales bacterium]|nr:riboflavin biosynthesis protein RibF [Bacteroidales bacterium]